MHFLVVGLGNPGSEYENTKHNVGFQLLDNLAKRCGVISWNEKWRGLVGTTQFEGAKIHFLKPQTYMNRSGDSVTQYINFFKIDTAHLMVIQDDLDMPLARVKFVKGGGNGGHNGIKSIESHLGTRDFYRLKIGIGRPGQGDIHPDFPIEKYVLSAFTSQETLLINERSEAIFSGFNFFVTGDIARATGIFNSLKK